MKNMLLTTALVGFAGAAAADGHLGVTFSGSATLGYNDTDLSAASLASGFPAADTSADESAGFEDNEFGFYSDLDVTIGFAAELDNGLVAAASIDLVDLADGAVDGADYELSLTSDMAGLFYGDTAMAADSKWAEVGDMGIDFSETDGEAVLRGEINYGNVDAALSYIIDDAANELEQLSLGVTGTFGTVDVTLAYQAGVAGTLPMALGDEDPAPANFDSGRSTFASGYVSGADFNASEILALRVGTSFAGADVALGYVSDETAGSNAWGVSVAYPVGPVALSASYADNSVSGEAWDIAATYANGPISVTASTDEGDSWALEGSYDVGSGLMVFAGVADAGDDYYVAGTYDLGSGANLLVSYAVDDSGTSDSEDEIGANDYQEGATVELSFAF